MIIDKNRVTRYIHDGTKGGNMPFINQTTTAQATLARQLKMDRSQFWRAMHTPYVYRFELVARVARKLGYGREEAEMIWTADKIEAYKNKLAKESKQKRGA
jgi:hypothetical protein